MGFVLGIDEEMKSRPDIAKKLEEMDDHDGGIDFDDEDESFSEIGKDRLRTRE
jgi:hypothetical protein